MGLIPRYRYRTFLWVYFEIFIPFFTNKFILLFLLLCVMLNCMKSRFPILEELFLACYIWIAFAQNIDIQNLLHDCFAIRILQNMYDVFQCFGSLTFWYGSGSTVPYFWLTDLAPDPALFISDLQDAIKKFSKFFCLLLFQGTFTSFFRDKKH